MLRKDTVGEVEVEDLPDLPFRSIDRNTDTIDMVGVSTLV